MKDSFSVRHSSGRVEPKVFAWAADAFAAILKSPGKEGSRSFVHDSAGRRVGRVEHRYRDGIYDPKYEACLISGVGDPPPVFESKRVRLPLKRYEEDNRALANCIARAALATERHLFARDEAKTEARAARRDAEVRLAAARAAQEKSAEKLVQALIEEHHARGGAE